MTGMMESLENDEFSSIYTGLTLYSYGTGFLCLAGAIGVARVRIYLYPLAIFK